jgi:hypothetical protein
VTPQPTPVVTSIGWGQSQPKVALGFCCEDIFGHCGFTMNELIGMLGITISTGRH